MPVTKKINQKCSEERDWYFMEGIYMKYDAWVHKKKIKRLPLVQDSTVTGSFPEMFTW